jgi:Binding-protein-dependent transport system inner membrane component/Bacterial extracellular solute-binding proteins, family 5 Middle
MSTLLISVMTAIPIGVLAAWKAGGWVDRLVMAFAVLGFSVPVFVLAYILIYTFAIGIKLFPVQGYVSIRDGIGPFLSHIALPSIAFGTVYTALIARITRASMLDVLAQHYIRAAQAKGLSNERVLIGHALKNVAVPMANQAGSEVLTGKRDYDKARQLIKEAGYNGEEIVLLDAVDQPLVHAEALVATDEMKKLGLNVEYVAADWGTVVTRRASKKPPAEGGWNMFETGWVGSDLLDPAVNVMLRANGDDAWFGWPKDDKLEALRVEWLKAGDLEARQAIAAQIQQRAFEVVPYVPTGQFEAKTAFRIDIKGYVSTPALFMWNVEKT